MIDGVGGPDFTLPGDPGALHAHAGVLEQGAAGQEQTGSALQAVVTSGWTGVAADAFRSSQRTSAQAWAQAGAAARRAAGALHAYADALQAAQDVAARAAADHAQGEALRRQAVIEHDAALAHAARVPAGTVVVVPPLTDPGAALRSRALGAMAGARGSASAAAASAADAVRAAAALAPLRPVVPAPVAPRIDIDDGSYGAGLYPGLPTDSVALGRLLDLARSSGLEPAQYADLLKQYWTARAAESAGIDLAAWDPSVGVDANRERIEAVYRYYGRLFLEHPELQWAGMANLIGPAFAGGFADLDVLGDAADAVGGPLDELPGWARAGLPPGVREMSQLSSLSAGELRFYESTLLVMQKQIFIDQGAMHEAYLSGDPAALDELRAAEVIDPRARDAWRLVASGDPAGVAEGSTMLLAREQNQVIPDEYDRMREHLPSGRAFTYGLTAVGAPSIPGAHTAAEFSPLEPHLRVPVARGLAHVDATLRTPLPDFDLSYREARWDMVLNDTLPAYQHLLATDPQGARALVQQDVHLRIEQQRLWEQKEAIADRLTSGWELDVRPGLGPGVARR